MSRRSLRLDGGLLDRRPLPSGSASLVVGGALWRSSGPRRSQRHSASCSESLLVGSPQKAVSQFLHNSSVNSVASDASLISSLLDESSIQESTLVETFWGLDQDADPRESTIIASESSTLIGSDSVCAKHSDQALSRVSCKDCDGPSVPKTNKETKTETSTIYYRGRKSREDVLHLWLNSSLLFVSRAAACCASALQLTWRAFQPSSRSQPIRGGARSRDSGVMALKEASPEELHPVGSLCDDCKEKQRSQLDISSSSSSSSSSWSTNLLEFMCSASVFTAAALWLLSQLVFSALLRGGHSAGCMFRWINRQWSHMSSSSRLSKLFIVLLLLLLFSLSWYRPAGIYSLLLGINIADIPGLSSVRSFLPLQSQSAEGAAEELVQSHPLSAEMLPQEAPTPAPPEGMDSEQLVQMEQSLRALWEGMEAAGRRAEESHKELLQLYTDLRQQASGPQRSEYDMELWMRALMEQQLSLLRRRLNEERRLREQVGNATSNNQFNISADSSLHFQEVRVMVMEALKVFSQDRTGLADYALESGGGSILSTRCSETYQTKAALLSLFGFPLWYFSQSPRTVIQPDVHPGNCWAFRGSKGFLVIQLSMKILPTAVTMEHVSKSLAPSGTLRSAPRDFSVYGLKDEHEDRGKLLGNYTYDEDGEDLQMFTISEENDEAFQIIEVQVLSNWGHPEYTCMYRFRVHGLPSDV
ncbi:uncharacterized protein LOC103147092 [Poecilia formosa]|nr:PREDICTED: uncharacterized protein LOC103147092 [Poecilia formosa]